jgi:hypothetical protein
MPALPLHSRSRGHLLMSRKSQTLISNKLAAELDARYAGSWVAIVDGRVIASCSSDAELPALLALAREQGAALHLVPPSGTTYVLAVGLA